MKDLLNSVQELQSKYVDLPDYKKISCLPLKQLLPKMKYSKEEFEELSEHKQELVHKRKKKRRKYKNSFLYSKNLVEWTQEELD